MEAIDMTNPALRAAVSRTRELSDYDAAIEYAAGIIKYRSDDPRLAASEIFRAYLDYLELLAVRS